ncbi:DNA cytosine methyltransferase [Nocardia carnea]|uniref:DNA cytosine methyltransferase n=1 Tax=Nocardia carnea TaxID=37328 RepID=UPI0024573C05|nr:DNA cytosine methyltransferase [Nocardia carnea]
MPDPMLDLFLDGPERPTVTDFFCGGSGSGEGLTQAGLWVQVGCNHDPVSIRTSQGNHPETEFRCESLSRVGAPSGVDVLDFATLPHTDVLWASPSCVWHSRSGGRRAVDAATERLFRDPGSVDRATALAIVEAAEMHRYPIVIVENVPEFLAWTLFGWWADGLAALDYTRQDAVLDAVDFGHAQRRKRWFGVFTQPGVKFEMPAPTGEPVYAASILEPDPGKPVTRRLYVSPQIEAIAEADTPHMVTYRRNARPLRADRHPMPTVTAGGNHHGIATIDRDGRARHRMASNLECARAQGFPDHYRWHGTKAQVKRQIGNAVPVGIARALGEQAALALGYGRSAERRTTPGAAVHTAVRSGHPTTRTATQEVTR